MTKNPFLDSWLKTDISNNMPGFRSAPIDMKALMEASCKTIQAFTEAQQIAIESFQTIAQRQGQIFTQIVQDHSDIARDIVHEGTPEEKIARSAELLRRSYEKTINSSREVADMLGKSTRQASDIINKRVVNALDELKVTTTETQSASSKTDKEAA